MPIYFPRGFNSGEPVRVVDGVTVVRGALARQAAELIVVASPRTLLGAPANPAARAALAAFGADTGRRARALPRGSCEVHELTADVTSRRWLAFVELGNEPRRALEIDAVVGRVAAFAAKRGAAEVALTPFGRDGVAARRLVEVLRERPAPPRWIVVVRDRAQFEVACGGAASGPASP